MPREDSNPKAFDDLLRRMGHLRRSPAEGCPGPEIIAAYYEHSLAGAERERWERHFSDCPRCQAHLAALTRAEGESSPFAASVAARRPLLERLLGPGWALAAAAAVAAVVVTAIIEHGREGSRPASQVAVAQKSPPLEIAKAEPGTARRELRQGSSQVPAQLSSAPVPERSREATVGALSSPIEAKPSAATGAAAPGVVHEGSAARQGPGASQSAAPAPASSATVSPEVVSIYRMEAGQGKPVAPGGRGAGPPATAAPKGTFALESASRAASRPSVGVASAPAGAASAPQPEALLNRPGPRSELKSEPRPSYRPVIVESADHSTFWRIGPGGAIYRAQGGASWRKEESGATADLFAGAAPSPAVCWVVGQAGTVLRTIDGVHWERVMPPIVADLVRVSARDADSAIVITADGRRFSTSDGGKTWRPG